jgi:hypothetical protein
MLLYRHKVDPRHCRGYLAFARKVDELTCRYSSNTLLVEVDTQLHKFAQEGYDPEVLAAIRMDVFTLGMPWGC